MLRKIAKKIKAWLPPAIIDIYRKYCDRYGFFAGYENWAEAAAPASGYDSAVILEKVKNALLKVKNGEALYERDSVLFDKTEYSWPLLTCLLYVAAENDGRLNLLDFGGSLGSTYYQNLNFLKNLSALSWNIVEQDNFAECGKKYFADSQLHFYKNIATCLDENKSQVALLSGSLQYLETPFVLLKEIMDEKIGYIIIDRLPINFVGDIITLQKVNPIIYDASYPAWILSESSLLKFFRDQHYSLIADFDALGGKFNIKNYPLHGFYKGYFFVRNKN
jgi:putative methyltransferase (TIGR04325 family)